MRFYAPSQMKSVKDIAGFTRMKYRQDIQKSLKNISRDEAKIELEEREREHFSKLSREEFVCTLFLEFIKSNRGMPTLIISFVFFCSGT